MWCNPGSNQIVRERHRAGRPAGRWQIMAENGRKKATDAFALAIAAGSTVRDAAKTARVSERTAYRRMEDPSFRRRVSEARHALTDRTIGILASASTVAATTLWALLKSGKDTVRLGAARAILDAGQRLRELGEVEDRLVELEQRLDECEQQET